MEILCGSTNVWKNYYTTKILMMPTTFPDISNKICINQTNEAESRQLCLTLKKKKKKTWKEKLETSVRQVNLQNEESVDNKGLRPRHKADQISNNTLNFPLCDPSPLLLPPPSVPLNSNIQINQSSSGVPCTFPAQRFQLSKPPSLQLLISLSPFTSCLSPAPPPSF